MDGPERIGAVTFIIRCVGRQGNAIIRNVWPARCSPPQPTWQLAVAKKRREEKTIPRHPLPSDLADKPFS
ncbi:hypothetical protein ACLOJK_009590 [Asimina triloba]